MLAKAGVPWSEAITLDSTVRAGLCIAAGIVDGGTFDWEAGRWRKPNA